MDTQSPEQVIARIDELRRSHGPGVVAFDGDGTLWSGDVGEDFFHAMVARGRFEPPAVEAMRREADEFRVDGVSKGASLAARLYEAYQAGAFPEERICELMAWGCAGWTRGEVDALAHEVVDRTPFEPRLHREALHVLEWARGCGIEVFLVSASPRAVVELAAARIGIDSAHVVAADPVWGGESMRAEVKRPIPYGPGKVVRLVERAGERPLLAAFGDNLFDIPLLRHARVPVAVRPKPRLAERAGEVEGLVQIAPPR